LQPFYFFDWFYLYDHGVNNNPNGSTRC